MSRSSISGSEETSSSRSRSPVFSAGSSSSPSPTSDFSFTSEEQRISDSEFEFDSVGFPDTGAYSEPPLSPKLICPNSSPSPYNWSPAAATNFPQQPITTLRPPPINLPRPATVRQHDFDSDFDFKTAPSTPRSAPVTPRGSSARHEFAETLKNYYRDRETEACPSPQEAAEERKGKKASSSKRWAFKDLLRRTVPSSKFDSPAAMSSPSPSACKGSARRPLTPPMSPARRSAPSPPLTPRSAPLSPRAAPLAAHFQHHKIQSQDIRRKTFLPYRQSLLGCLGGGAFVSETGLQKAW